MLHDAVGVLTLIIVIIIYNNNISAKNQILMQKVERTIHTKNESLISVIYFNKKFKYK